VNFFAVIPRGRLVISLPAGNRMKQLVALDMWLEFWVILSGAASAVLPAVEEAPV
jgi:hypothetical protein